MPRADTAAAPKTSRGPGRPPRSAEQRAAQRARLLDSAMAAIRRVGPEVSVDEIAEEAGVSKPVFYDEFGGKNGIAEAVAVELAAAGERRLLEELSQSGQFDVDTGVRIAIRTLFRVVLDEPEIYGFLVRAIRSSDQGLLDNALVRALHARVRMLTDVIAPMADGDLRSVLTYGTFGFIFAAVESWQTTKSPSLDELVDALSAIVLNGFPAIAPGVKPANRP